METPIIKTPITDQIEQYLETNFELLKLQGIDKASAIFAALVTDLILAILVMLTFILLSITLALFLGQLLSSGWQGFGCVTLFYMMLIFIARLLKISLQNLFIRLFIQKIFKKK